MATRPKVKVRTGCLTCKARKVKCDESTPSCRKCTSSGRKCHGYANSNDALQLSKPSPRRSRTPGDLALHSGMDRLLSNALNNDEHRWLYHFSSHTGPALSDFPADQYFWSGELPQMSLSEPAIRHALLAVSSCHARFQTELGNTKHLDEIVDQDFTIKQYNLAIASLRQTTDLHETKLQVALICCLLFICLECFYGNTNLTLTHLENGLKILDSHHVHEGSRSLQSISERLKPMFNKFTAQSTVFGISAPFSTTPLVSMDFTDAFTAKARLDVVITACMSFVKHMRTDYGESPPNPDDPKRPLQKSLLDQLSAWETQMHSLEQNDPACVDPNDASVIMLHVRQQGTFVYVANCLDPEQTFCDAFLARFKAITDLVERFVGCSSNKTSPTMQSLLSSAFSLESSMIPALYLTAIKCRDPSTRTCAIGLLETHFRREGLWDARLYAKAAKRVVEIEDSSLPLQHQRSSQWPDEGSRVYRTDVNRLSEEPARTARLVFYTAPNGYFGDKVIWNEDVTF